MNIWHKRHIFLSSLVIALRACSGRRPGSLVLRVLLLGDVVQEVDVGHDAHDHLLRLHVQGGGVCLREKITV